MHIGGIVSGPASVRVKNGRQLMRSHLDRYYFVRKHYGDAAVQLFRVIMTAGATLRLLKYRAVWLACASRRAEAAPKIKAYGKIALRGLAPRPEALPEDLRREGAEAALFRLRRSELGDPALPLDLSRSS